MIVLGVKIVTNIHDNELISYDVNLKNEVINIHTLSESGQKVTLYEVLGTRLSSEPIPDLATIALDPEFSLERISKNDFEDLWRVKVLELLK
jgi:hypothetical protein